MIDRLTAGGGSDDDSVVHRQQGTVLYDFTPEEEDEVAVMKGDKVDIEYEVGGWLQVRRTALVRRTKYLSIGRSITKKQLD